MNFGQALEALKEGKKIKRSFWGGYWFLENQLFLDDNETEYMNPFIIAKLKDNGGIAPATAYQADLLAEDWEVVE